MSTENPHISIGNRRIGPGWPAYIIAELSANHNGRFEDAVDLIAAAKKAGADAVKLQTYTPDTITLDVDTPMFRHAATSPWANRTLYDLYSEAYMPWEWQPKLKTAAADIGIDLFSSAFDPSAVEFLEDMDVPAHKISSFEIVDIPLIEKMAATGKPLIISTGMATFREIEEAVEAASGAGAAQIALLKCTSAYPAPPEEMNLRTIVDMMETFRVPVGLSDHTLGFAVPITAVACGASIVEKHFTLSRKTPGPDSTFSLEPAEFKQMVDGVRIAEEAIGEPNYDVTEREAPSRRFRRSLFVVEDMEVGDSFTRDNVRSIRPGNGLHPRYQDQILGKKVSRRILKGTPLSWDLVASED